MTRRPQSNRKTAHGFFRAFIAAEGRLPSTHRETTIDALHLTDMAQARAFFAAQDRIDMTICYCSVCDDCRIARKHDPNVRPAARCERAGEQFEERL